MAINITTEPTYPNVTYTDLLYAVSSSLISNDQYQYVMDVVQAGEVLVRIKQYPNPAGTGIFNPARILNDYIEYNQSWKTNNEFYPTTTVQTFSIRFGEEYGTSPSSSVTLYNGVGVPGPPIVSGSDALVFPGTVDPNNGISFNWQSQSMALTDTPYEGQELSYDDYHTMAFYNDGGYTNMSVEYSPGPTLSYSLTSGSNGFTTVPISTLNIGAGAAWDSVIVTAGSETWTFNKAEECNYDRIRFAFVNEYGFWDYYGFNLPQRKITTVNRQQINRPFVNYSTLTAAYQATRRGKDYYNIQYNDSITVTTPFVDQTTAEWLAQMLESPSVFVQDGDNFLPIIITNGNYTHNTNKRSQKTFQYDISFQYSNTRLGR